MLGKLALLALLCLLPYEAWAGLNTSCHQFGPNGQPAPAATYNFNCLRIYENWRSTATIDGSDTRASGFTWYPHNNSTQTPPGTNNAGGWQQGRVGPTPITDWSVSDGQLTLNPVSGTPYSNYPSMFMTCAQVGTTQQLVGTPYGPGSYVNIQTISVPSGQAEGMWAIAWGIPTWIMNGGVGAFLDHIFEPDYFEGLDGSFAIHDWGLSGATVNYNNAYAVFGLTTGPQLLGSLAVTASQNDGSDFVFKRYIDGSLLAGSACTGNPSSPASCSTSPSNPNGTFTGINTQQHCLTLSGGPGHALTVGPIEVWTR